MFWVWSCNMFCPQHMNFNRKSAGHQANWKELLHGTVSLAFVGLHQNAQRSQAVEGKEPQQEVQPFLPKITCNRRNGRCLPKHRNFMRYYIIRLRTSVPPARHSLWREAYSHWLRRKSLILPVRPSFERVFMLSWRQNFLYSTVKRCLIEAFS